MKLFRIILKEKDGNRVTRRWAKSEDEVRKDIRRFLPFSEIEKIIEVTAETLTVKR